MSLNFKCEQLTITDDSEFGCTIEFSDSVDKVDEFTPLEELLHPKNKYLLMQRSYPEDEDEIDWYTVETSEIEIDFSQRDNIYVTLNKNEFKIYCSGVTIRIELKLFDKEYSNLVMILRTRFKGKVVMLKE